MDAKPAVPGVMQRLWLAVNASHAVKSHLDNARHALEAENASVLLLDDEGENLVFAAVAGAHADKYLGGSEFEHALRVPMLGGRGLTPLAVLYGKPISMSEQDPRHNPELDELVGTKTHNLYVIPLAAAGNTLGAFGCINAHGGATADSGTVFSAADVQNCSATAQAISAWFGEECRATLDEL